MAAPHRQVKEIHCHGFYTYRVLPSATGPLALLVNLSSGRKGSTDTWESCHTSEMYPHQFLRTIGKADRDLLTARELPCTMGLLPWIPRGGTCPPHTATTVAKCSEKPAAGAEEMVPSVKYLLCQHKGLRSIPDPIHGKGQAQ